MRIYRLLNSSQRLSLAQAEQVSLQSNVRTGSLVVPNELRELNTFVAGSLAQNDIILPLAADAITYRAMRGLGFLCQAPAAGELRIAQSSWTGLRDPAANRDDVYLFIDGDADDEADDVVAPGGHHRREQLDLAAPYRPSGSRPPRCCLRSKCIHRFGPSRSWSSSCTTPTAQWWLGARSVNPGEAVQPVLGPLTANGFQLEYLNSLGVATADEKAIKSIRVTVRGLTEDAVRHGGFGAMGHPGDSLVTQVMLRNSIRP